jgi:hypothetical protein
MEMSDQLSAPVAFPLGTVTHHRRLLELLDALPLLGIKPQILSCPSHSLVTTETTISWLLIWTVGKLIKLTFQKEGKHVSVSINYILKC